jgi:hypothetical protein
MKTKSHWKIGDFPVTLLIGSSKNGNASPPRQESLPRGAPSNLRKLPKTGGGHCFKFNSGFKASTSSHVLRGGAFSLFGEVLHEQRMNEDISVTHAAQEDQVNKRSIFYQCS